jgi:hypothetical protein
LESRLDIQLVSAPAGAVAQARGAFDGQMLFATVLDECEELSELLGSDKPVADGAPHREVVGECLARAFMRRLPEEGRVIVRKALRSSLA